MRRRTLLATCLATPALAQTRPIRMIIGVAVAGASDIFGRILADAMQPILGRTIVVENIAGAGSTLAAAAFHRLPADGSSLYLATNNHALMKLVYPTFPHDPLEDFTPVAIATRQPFVLTVHPDVPARSVPELLAWLRQKGDSANFGGAQPGGNNFMAGALLRHLAGVNFTIVSYRSAPASVQDLVAGRLDLTIDSPTMLLPLIRDGKARGLAVSTPQASPVVPGLAPIGENVPGYDMTLWTMLFTRPGTPADAVATLRDAAARALADPAVKARVAAAGGEVWDDPGPATATAQLRADIARWLPILPSLNLNPS